MERRLIVGLGQEKYKMRLEYLIKKMAGELSKMSEIVSNDSLDNIKRLPLAKVGRN